MDPIVFRVVARYLVGKTITKRDLEPWKADLRRMTKIYRSIPAAEEEKRHAVFVEAKKLFRTFADNFQHWVYKTLLPTLNPENKGRSKSYAEEQVRSKAWSAIVSLRDTSDLFPSQWDYKTDTYEEAPWKITQNVDGNIRRYQRLFTQAFDAIEEFIEAQTGGTIERREDFERTTIAGMNVLIQSFGRDDTDYEEDVDNFLHKLSFFAKRIERAGFGDALRGLTVNVTFADPEKLGRPTDLTAGLYRADKDAMEIYPLGFISSDGGTFTHEVGHRFWFKNLGNNARAHWNDVMGARMAEITQADVNEFVEKYLAKHTNIWSTRELVAIVDRTEDDPEKAAKFKELATWSRPLDVKNDDTHALKDILTKEIGTKVHIEDISEYARTSPTEAFAEAFRWYILKGPGALGPWTRQFFETISRSGGAKMAHTYDRRAGV